MGTWLPFGFFDIVANAVSWVLEKIFDNVFFRKLTELIAKFGVIIANAIWKVFAALLSYKYFLLLLAVLKVVDFLESCFNMFAGISTITVRSGSSSTQTTLQNLIFTQSGVSRVFWGVALIACVLLVAFTIVGLLRSAADMEGKRPVGKVMGSAGKACLTFLLVPLVAYTAMELASLLLIKTSELIGGGGMDVSMGNYIFSAIIQDAQRSNGVAKLYLTGARSYTNLANVLADVSIASVHTTVGIFCGALIALFLIMGMLIFIRRLFELVLLFLTAPYFAATMPLDGGQKFGQWRDMFLGKLVSGFGMVFSIKIYLMLVPIIMNSNVQFFTLNFSDMVCKLIFLAGGAFAAYKSHSLLTQIINFQAAHAENESGMILGGMILSKVSHFAHQGMHGMMGPGGGPRGGGGGPGGARGPGGMDSRGGSGGGGNHSGTAPGGSFAGGGLPPARPFGAGGAATAAGSSASLKPGDSLVTKGATFTNTGSGTAIRTTQATSITVPAGSDVMVAPTRADAPATGGSSSGSGGARAAPAVPIPQSAYRPRAATLPVTARPPAVSGSGSGTAKRL